VVTRMLKGPSRTVAGAAVRGVAAVLAIAGTPLATVAQADRGGTAGAGTHPAAGPAAAYRGGTLTLAAANEPGAYTNPLPQAFDPSAGYGTLIARAGALQTTTPSAASTLWASIDSQVTNNAPWVPMKVDVSADFVSRRVGDYKACWLSGEIGYTGACLDRLWVH
jgi:hypothetical protein